MRWGWVIGAVILVVAAASTWFAFQSPGFVAGLTAIAAGAAWKALAPAVLKQEDPAVRKARQQCERSGGVWDHTRNRCRNR